MGLMSTVTAWYIVMGALLFAMGIATSYVRGLPVTTAVIYLLIGFALGPYGVGLVDLDPIRGSAWLERLTEIVVIISLFAAGLKLRLPLLNRRWLSSVRLALVSMLITIGLVAAFAHVWLGLSAGASILLGAILSPTDPVLASGIQVKGPEDNDHLRFSLTGEAGLNDGTAFPFVMLGLGLMGLHNLGTHGLRWVIVDLIWATVAGLAVGAALGTVAAHLAMQLRHKRREVMILDDFLALGLIALSYGVALLIHAYGFLAVFAAGLALRRVERLLSGEIPPKIPQEIISMESPDEREIEPDKEPALMAKAALVFDEQMERLGEVTTVVLVGGMIALSKFVDRDFLLLLFLFFLVRPLSIWIGLWRDPASAQQRRYLAWFGIRGIGSLYYLMYAIQQGIPMEVAERLQGITVAAVAFSVLVHGVTATPLMNVYQRDADRKSTALAADHHGNYSKQRSWDAVEPS